MKSPSLWAKDVDVSWLYAWFDTAAMPVELHSTAAIRFPGTASLHERYVYSEIDGRPVSAPILP